MDKPGVTNVLIVGGGTAGWSAAASLSMLIAALASAALLMAVPIEPPLLGYPSLEFELRALNVDRLTTLLGGLLSKEQIVALIQRRDRVISTCTSRAEAKTASR